MKHLIFYSLLILFVCCKKSESDEYWDTISAEKNGMPWSAELYAGQNNLNSGLIDILIHKYNSQGFLREELYFFKLKLTNERQRIYFTTPHDSDLKAGADYATLVDDGDVGCDNYHVLPADTLYNQLTLTQIKSSTGEINGNFDLRLVIDTGRKCNPAAPDTIYFRNGNFHTWF